MKSVLFSFAAVAFVASTASAAGGHRYGTRTPSSNNATANTAASNTAAVDIAQSPAANPSSNITAPAAHKTLNWDAYADVAARLPNHETFPVTGGPVVQKGFGLNDAALYLSKDFSMATAVVDLPFYSGSESSNNFAFATQKAQAYVNMNFGAVAVKLGQYDTFFGVEANDSIARFFAASGLMKTYVLPTTHTGAQVAWGFANKFTLRGQIANPNSAGLLATGTDPEIGGQFRWDSGPTFAAFGVEYGMARLDSNKTNLLAQVMGGTAIGKFSFGGELNSKNAAGTDKSGLGIGLLGAMQATDLWAFGARVDYMQDMVYTRFVNAPVANPASFDKAFLISVGPSYKLDADLTVRGDISYLSGKNSGQDTNDIFGLTLSIVARL